PAADAEAGLCPGLGMDRAAVRRGRLGVLAAGGHGGGGGVRAEPGPAVAGAFSARRRPRPASPRAARPAAPAVPGAVPPGRLATAGAAPRPAACAALRPSHAGSPAAATFPP